MDSLRRGLAVVTVAALFGGCGGGSSKPRDPRPSIVPTPQVGQKATPTPARAAVEDALDAVYRRHANDIVGACLGAIVERTPAIRCYGRVSRESSQRPTPKTLFQVGSIAKTMTATLLALRARDGSVRFGDPLRRLIPRADHAEQLPASLTLALVATHHSGLPRSTPVDNVASLDEYLGLAGLCEASPGCAVGAPGQVYVYSNFAYGVMGQALGIHDGYRQSSYSAWEKDVRANVTGPLAMPDTRSWYAWRATSPVDFDTRRARALIGDPPHEDQPPYYPPAPYGDPAAGMYSTATDMLHWLSYSMGLGGTPKLDAARPLLYGTRRLIRPRQAGDPRHAVGLAWDVDAYADGTRDTTCISKDGSARGFRANMIFVPDERRGAFVMLNSRPEVVTTPEIASELINSLPRSPDTARAPGRCGVFTP